MLSESDRPVAIVHQTDLFGLYDVQVTTGEQFCDITTGQVQYLAAKHGWTLVPAKADASL